jgi:spermidine synthase
MVAAMGAEFQPRDGSLGERELRRVLFALFAISGFCGLLYQVVWLRLALSSFGVITPIVSVVVSVFMLGLSLGSWLGGRWIGPVTAFSGVSAIVFYAGAELLIACGSLLLPELFELSRSLLLPIGGMESNQYLLLSAALIAICMLPWCFCMGLTYPLVMAFITETRASDEQSFSFLYLANVLGAMCGTILTSFVLIELMGFRHTLQLAGCLNLLVAAIALVLWRDRGGSAPAADGHWIAPALPGPVTSLQRRMSWLLLFITGFASMALEIIWMRAFTPILGTLVYAFSGLLTVYLLATWLGSLLYRSARSRNRAWPVTSLVAVVALTALLPNLASDPRLIVAVNRALFTTDGSVAIPLALASIFPFCAALGYLTPMLIDQDSRGEASRAGQAYAVNIVGSILGPLAAAYWLLPLLGSRLSMLWLAGPFLLLYPVVSFQLGQRLRWSRLVPAVAAVALIVTGTGLRGISYEEGSHIAGATVRRDHTATVISFGKGLRSHLVVNGHGMTTLSPLTKIMAHLPLASLQHDPKRALVIAFGMGTTYRSLLSWNIDVTAVELVPSVLDAFEYYFPDAKELRTHPKGHLVVDDGRRFLARSSTRFDVITVDPPPPVEAAGSSMLYAEEFYSLIRQHLAPGGIFQQWFPNGVHVEPATRQAVLRSVLNSFAHVRIFRSLQGGGLHILCSDSPIEVPAAEQFAARLPPLAALDLLEWSPQTTLPDFIAERILANELEVESLIRPDFQTAITDDRPFNEYFVVRRLFD